MFILSTSYQKYLQYTTYQTQQKLSKKHLVSE